MEFKYLRLFCSFVRRDFCDDVGYKLEFAMKLLRAMVLVLTVYFLSKMMGSSISDSLDYSDYFSFALIGVVFSSIFNSIISIFSERTMRSITQGTLEPMLATPTNSTILVLLSCSWRLLYDHLLAAIALFVGIFFLDARLQNADILAAIVVFVLSLVIFIALGLMSGGILLVTKRGDPFQAILMNLSALLGGVMFPVSVLPHWLQDISEWLPLTISLAGLRKSLLNGHSLIQIEQEVTMLILLALIIFPIAILFCNSMGRIARKQGSLASY